MGRYVLAGPIAVGGMASVHYGQRREESGALRTVAIKRMLQEYAQNPDARAMFLDEARLAARIDHPNVVRTFEVVDHAGELFLVLEYVHGESLDVLLQRARERGEKAPPDVVAAVLAGVLRGLHAAHEATAEDGAPLELVHRDLSPHNVLVDAQGVARVLDFGVARARGRLQRTREGQLKGKLAYLSPEQVHGDSSRRSDVFAAGVVLFEALTGTQLFQGRSEAEVLSAVLLCKVPSLASLGVDAPAMQAVLDRALEREPDSRFATAAAMAEALEAAGVASAERVAAWVHSLVGERLEERQHAIDALGLLPTAVTTETPLLIPPPRPEARQAQRGLTLLVAGAVAVVAVVGGLLVQASRPVAAARPAPPRVDPRTVAVPPETGDAGVLAAVAEPVAVDAGPMAEPAQAMTGTGGAMAEPAIPPPAPKAGIHRSPVHRTPPPPAPPAPQPAASTCNPPYVIDGAGVKRFKVECLK